MQGLEIKYSISIRYLQEVIHFGVYSNHYSNLLSFFSVRVEYYFFSCVNKADLSFQFELLIF